MLKRKQRKTEKCVHYDFTRNPLFPILFVEIYVIICREVIG